MDTYVYDCFGNVYINLTNRCCNHCSFCIRNGRDSAYGSDPLWLKKEPTAEEVIALLKEYPLMKTAKEAVFCGFGEPTYRINAMTEIGSWLKRAGKMVRLNTNGLGSLIQGRDITDDVMTAADIISVSLNASTPQAYQNICASSFGKQSFDAMLSFTETLVKKGADVRMSVVDVIGAQEIEACRKIAERVGAKFRVRKLD